MDNFKNVVVLTTFWDRVDSEANGVDRERQLKAEFFKDIVAGGGCFMRYDRTAESARAVLQQIIPLPPTTLQIQKEIRVEGKRLEDTSAGSVHREEVDALIAKHKADMDTIKAEMKEARESGEKARKELKREQAMLRKVLKRWKDEKSELQKGLDEERECREQLEKEVKEGRKIQPADTDSPKARAADPKNSQEQKCEEEIRRMKEIVVKERMGRAEAEAKLDKITNKNYRKKGIGLAKEVPFIPTFLLKAPLAATGAAIDLAKTIRGK